MQKLIQSTHPQWHQMLEQALNCVNQDYLRELEQTNGWLPGKNFIFSAFKLPLDKIQYVLLGESPYPRAQSANGYAFWDNAVGDLWSSNGLSKEVNRATSLRNMIKMLLVAKGDLKEDCSQTAIAKLDKSRYWTTASQLFQSMLNQGFLLLNASLVYSEGQVPYHAKQWQPFINSLFNQLLQSKKPVQLILLGKIAAKIDCTDQFPGGLVAEHPYNLSFINNADVLSFFKPLDLLSRHE